MAGVTTAQSGTASDLLPPAPSQPAAATNPDQAPTPPPGLGPDQLPPAAPQTPAPSAPAPTTAAETLSPSPAAPTTAAAPEAQPIPTTQPAAPLGQAPQAEDVLGLTGEGSGVKQASCSTCGGGLLGAPGPGPGLGGCACCGGCGGECVPGRLHCCSCCDGNSCCARMLCGLYECICCPDPCYEGHWVAAANAAFFTDAARPVTQIKLGYDGLYNMTHIDRAEYLFARFNVKTDVLPGNATGQGNGRGLSFIPGRADLNVVDYYTEVARGRFSFFIDLPYREAEYTLSAAAVEAGSETVTRKSGLGDMYLGTKSMLLDCELLQLTFQFKTYLPTASPGNGLGTGHTALEPALLFALKLTPDCYLQGETAYWFALGGDQTYEGTVWHNHLSLNGVLIRFLPDVQLIGTLEGSAWGFMNGDYTNTDALDGLNNPFASRADSTILAAGSGLRLNICDKIDFGLAMQFWFSRERIADQELKAEFRWRF
jgi:hypothetical protein